MSNFIKIHKTIDDLDAAKRGIIEAKYKMIALGLDTSGLDRIHEEIIIETGKLIKEAEALL